MLGTAVLTMVESSVCMKNAAATSQIRPRIRAMPSGELAWDIEGTAGPPGNQRKRGILAANGRSPAKRISEKPGRGALRQGRRLRRPFRSTTTYEGLGDEVPTRGRDHGRSQGCCGKSATELLAMDGSFDGRFRFRADGPAHKQRRVRPASPGRGSTQAGYGGEDMNSQQHEGRSETVHDEKGPQLTRSRYCYVNLSCTFRRQARSIAL